VRGGLPGGRDIREPAENTDAERYSPGERYAKTYEINMLRAFSADTAKMPARRMRLSTDVYELSAGNRRDLIYTKDMLILPPPSGKPGTPQQVKEGTYPRAILPDGLVSEP
jgi:NADH-quinone oxidoreductase subunit I